MQTTYKQARLMQTTYKQAQLNNSATFVEILDILVKIVLLEMPLATFVKRLAIILKCVKNVLETTV